MQSSERSSRSSRKIIPQQTSSPDHDSQSDTGHYLCIDCSETFDTSVELNSHRQIHVTRKQFMCTHCGRGFHHQVFLQMHERSHEEGGSAVKPSPGRVISTRSSKMSDVVHVKPTKPQHHLNSIVEFKSEPKVCPSFTPKEFVTRRSHGAISPVSQKKDDLEKKDLFELRLSKFSDTTVHLMDSFGNSIEILADVFNTYTIGEPEENGMSTDGDEAFTKTSEKSSSITSDEALTKTSDKSPSRNDSDEKISESLREEPSVLTQSNETQPSQLTNEMPNDRLPSHESVTSESNTSNKLDTDDAGLPVPAPSAATTEQVTSQPIFQTIESASPKDSLQPSSVSQETVSYSQAVDSVIASKLPLYEDHMDTSPEDAAGPTSPEELQNKPKALLEVDQTPERSSTSMTSPADESIGSSDSQDKHLDEDSSITAVPVELPSQSKPQSLLDEPISLKDPACNVPKTHQDNKPRQEMIADVEQNQDLTLLKTNAEIRAALILPANSPPVRQEDLSSAMSVNVSAYSPPLEDSYHKQSSQEGVDGCNTLAISRDDVSSPTQNKSVDTKSTKELGAQSEEAPLSASEEHSERIGGKAVIPEKIDPQSASIKENAESINRETESCVTSEDGGEVPILDSDVRSPQRKLQNKKDLEKHGSPLTGRDILHEEDLVIDDKRDEDLFERDIFPLEVPMEVCEKGLASIDEEQNIVCGAKAHTTKMVQNKESDICLNGGNMTYISESEMIKLLEQDKDDITDDEPTTTDQKDLENTGLAHSKDLIAFSEPKLKPELSHNTEETKSSTSPGNTVDGMATSKHSGLPASLEEDTAEAPHYEINTDPVSLTSESHNLIDVHTIQATPEEKMDTDSCLPTMMLTSDDSGIDREPQDLTESMLTQDSVSKNEQLGFTETSSSTNIQSVTREHNADIPEPGLPCGDQNDKRSKSTPGNQYGSSALSRTKPVPEHTTSGENIDVFVTVEDNESDEDKVGQINPLESPSLKDAVIKLGQDKPHTSIHDHKGVASQATSTTEPKQTKTLGISSNLPSPQKVTDHKPFPKHGDETKEPKHVDEEMKPPLDVPDTVQSTTDDKNETSSERTNLKNKGMQGGVVFLLKDNEKYVVIDDSEADICSQEPTADLTSNLNHVSETLSTAENVDSEENYLDMTPPLKGARKDKLGELTTANMDISGVDNSSIIKDMEDLEKPTVALPKAINDPVSEVLGDDNDSTTKKISNVDKPVGKDSIQGSLEDSEPMENDHQVGANSIETPSKPLGVGGECLKCGRKLRRSRKELVWQPVCFKCRKAAKKQERLSNQKIGGDLDLTLTPLGSRREERLSADLKGSPIKDDEDGPAKDISKEPTTTSLDPLFAVDEKEALGSISKKIYKCLKCDETFKIPALLAGHIKCHTLPQCLTCGCSVRFKYKTKRIPRRCSKCFQQLKEKVMAGKKVGEVSGDEESSTSDDDVNQDEPDVSDEDSHVAIKKAKKTPAKVEKLHPCDLSHDDMLVLPESPEGNAGELEVGKEMPKKQEIQSSDELDISDGNLELPDGEKPRLCPHCSKAFPCNRSLNLHMLSHTGTQCESCGCRLPKRRRVGRWSKKCRGCRLQSKGKVLNDSGDEMDASGDKVLKQKRVKEKQPRITKNTKIQSIIKKKKELKWMNMLLAVKGLMDKSRKKKEDAMKAADPARKDGKSSEAIKCDESSADSTSIHPDHPKSDLDNPDVEKAGPSKMPGLTSTPKQGRKCLYREKNIIKVEENEMLPCIPSSAASDASTVIKQEESWQCLECNQSWPNSEALVNHQHSHMSSQSFKCPQCPQLFSGEQYLNIHIHAHDEDRPFRCPECDKTFTKRNHLGVHMRVHSGSRPYACPDCSCRFRQKVTLIAHRYSHRNYQLLFSKPFQCSVCSKSFKQKERLVVHERLHTGECPFSCKDCDKVFPSKARLYVHRKMHKICEASNSEQNSSSQEVSDDVPFKCHDCGKICSTKASFVLHRRIHKLSTTSVQSIKCEEGEEVHPFCCRECNKAFSSKASLAMHLKNHSAHKATAKSEMSLDLKECFPCKDCDKVCSTKASLVLHRKVHKSPTAGEQNLVIKVESDTPSYVCKDCNKVCSTKASLALHCRVHRTPEDTDAPSYRCKDCDMVCTTKSSFVLHRRVHRSSSSNQLSPKDYTEPQLYNCKHCDMVCSTKGSFTLHSRVHKTPSDGEQNLKADGEPQSYKCKHCDMVCSTKASFVLHNKVHRSSVSEQSPKAGVETKSYNCKLCETVCYTKSSLIQHRKMHRSLLSNEKSPKTSKEQQAYNCKHCDMVCTTKASFVLHSKVHRSSVIEQSLKAAEEPQSYSCKECDLVFSTKASFVLHCKVHKSEQSLGADTEENPFTCKECNKVCSTKASFILHRKMHKSSIAEHDLSPEGDGAAPSFPCKICGKIYSTKGRLYAHRKVHEDSPSDQNSDNEGDAEQPKKTSEEKLFSCPVCGLRFARLKMLVRHKAVHGERTVTPCIHCGKHFLYMKSLFNHIKICQSKIKGKKLRLLKKAAAKRKLLKDGGSTGSEGESMQKKRKTDEKPKAQKVKNKNQMGKTKKTVVSKEKGKGKGMGDSKTKEKRAKVEDEPGSEGEGKKTAADKQSDGKQEKSSEQTAKEPTPKRNLPEVKKVKKEPSAKDKPQKAGGTKKWGSLSAATAKKKKLQTVLIGGKKKLVVKKKVLLKAKSGGKAGKE